MRRPIAGLAVFCCLILAGCSRQPQPLQQPISFRTALLSGGCRFQAELTADYEDTVVVFSLACAYSPESGMQMEVLSPQTLAGIEAHMDGSGASVQFEDTRIAFGDLAGGNLSPMEAPYLITKCWEEAYISAAGMQEDLLQVTYLTGYDDEELTVDTWFDAASGAAQLAQISWQGDLAMTVRITDFSFYRGES